MNIKMRLSIATIMLSIVGMVYAQEGATTMHLTLDKAIELALDENPTIKVAEQEIRLKEVSKSEAWQSLLPTVSLDGSINYTIKAAQMKLGDNTFKMGKDDSNTWNGALNVSLPIFAPAAYRTITMSKRNIELAVEKSRGSKIDMVNQVTKAFYQLMLAQDSYNVLMENYKLAEKNYNIVKAKFDQGSVSEYDKISSEVQMKSAWPNVVSGENAVKLAKLQLKVLMGITADVDLVIDDKLTNYENEIMTAANGSQEISLENNSALRQIDLNSKLLSQTRKMLKTNFMPTIMLSGSYQYQSLYNTNFKVAHYDWANSSSLVLSMSIPLFKASNFTKLKSNRIQQWQLAENRINTERMLRMQAQSHIDNMTSSAEQLQSNKEAVTLAQKGLEISRKRYEVGKGTILELNSSQVSLTNVQLTYNNSIYDYLVAKSELNTVLGKE